MQPSTPLVSELNTLRPQLQRRILDLLSADSLSRTEYDDFRSVKGDLSAKLYRKLDHVLSEKVDKVVSG